MVALPGWYSVNFVSREITKQYISILFLQVWTVFIVFNFKNRLRIFDNRVLRKIFCPEGSEKDYIS